MRKCNELLCPAIAAGRRQTVLRPLIWLVLLMLPAVFASKAFSQVSVLNETFGTTTTLPANWAVSSSDWQCNSTVVSSGYTGASGGSNVQFVNNNTSEHTLTYSNLSTLNFTNITVLWGARHLSIVNTLTPISITLSWSTDGTTWNNVAFTNVAVSTGDTWALVNNGTRIALPAGAANAASLRLRFTAKASVAGVNTSYRIDDVTVQGCRINTGTLSYAGPFCKSVTTAQAVTLTNGVAGGTYSAAPAGLAINATTGAITPGSSTAGTYTVSYAAAATGTCATPATSTTQVTITAVPAATIAYTGSPFCTTLTTAQPVARTGTAGGTYSSAAGISMDAGTGAITPSNSTAGTYTVTYTLSGGGCATVTATASVTITSAPSATISYPGSPYCSDAGTATPALTGSTGGTYSATTGLSISSTAGTINLSGSTAGAYSVAYTVAAAGGCSAVTATAPVVIKTAGIWTGAVSSNFSTGGNWQCGSVPLSTTAIVVPAGLAVYPVLTGTAAATDIAVAAGASLTVKGTLQVAGTLTGSGKLMAADGTVEFTGTTAQTIPAGLLDSARVKNLTISNAAGVTMADSIKLTGILKITAGQLNTNGRLVLKSTATGTAMVAAITSSVTPPVNGKVVVERYVPGRRKYRLITSSVTTSTAATLATGQENLSIWAAWQNSGNNAAAGTGTFITGGSAADGFDTQTSNASLSIYDDVNRRFTGFTSASGRKTKYTPLKAGVAYYMFVYGDRTNTITTSTPNATVLSAAGTLLTGDQTYTTTSSIPLSGVAGRFTFLGNPFASAINWATLLKSNLDNAYWGWDPNLSGTGGYVTVLTTGTVTLQAPYTGTTGLTQYIQPGQGFFVKTTAASPTLTIREQDKATTFNASAFRSGGAPPAGPGLLAVNLLYNSGSNRVLADGVLTAFEDSMAVAGAGTATKIPNPSGENVALLQDSSWLSIHTRPLPRPGDTLRLNLWRLTRLQYTLQVFAERLPATGLQAYLYDQYLDTLHALSLTDTNNIAFDIIPGVAASADTSRFRIVFRQGNVPLPVKFISVHAAATGKQVQVAWAVGRETGIRQYVVERGADGTSFREAGTLPAKGLTTYQWPDTDPVAGINYYRIKAIEKDGHVIFSQTVLVKGAAAPAAVELSPNPVAGNSLTIRYGERTSGRYQMDIMSAGGSRVSSKEIDHPGGAFTQVIFFNKKLPAGVYYFIITNGSSRTHQTFIVQ